MSAERPTPWLPLGVLAVALLLWAGMFATGAYLQLGADAPRHDFRKPLIIMGSMAVFLSLWGLALWRQKRIPNVPKIVKRRQPKLLNRDGDEHGLEDRIKFPGYLERCCGFTIPENGVFFAFYFDEDLACFDVRNGSGVIVDEDWKIDEQNSTITIGDRTLPFLGLWGGNPLLVREELGALNLADSQVKLTAPNGAVKTWQFANFSGDWEHVTFDRTTNAFLFGAPYDFDFRYVKLR